MHNILTKEEYLEQGGDEADLAPEAYGLPVDEMPDEPGQWNLPEMIDDQACVAANFAFAGIALVNGFDLTSEQIDIVLERAPNTRTSLTNMIDWMLEHDVPVEEYKGKLSAKIRDFLECKIKFDDLMEFYERTNPPMDHATREQNRIHLLQGRAQYRERETALQPFLDSGLLSRATAEPSRASLAHIVNTGRLAMFAQVDSSYVHQVAAFRPIPYLPAVLYYPCPSEYSNPRLSVMTDWDLNAMLRDEVLVALGAPNGKLNLGAFAYDNV